MIKKRSIVACILLSILTCFIYTMYWIVVINDEILMLADEEGTSGTMVLVLTIVTCGLYGIYWCCKMAGLLNKAKAKKGMVGNSNKPLYVIFYIFGVIIAMAMMQSEVNKLADYYKA